jgi:cytoskeleton protein RodZ
MDPTDSNDTGREAKTAQAEQTTGQLLRAARLDRGMSIEDVARQLRLSVRQVTALEDDDYDKFPSTTFLRGFVRNYAKLLQMDAASLLQRLQQSVPPPSAPTISYQIEGIPFPSNHKRGKLGLVIAGAVILALLLLIFEIYDANDNKEKQPAVKTEIKNEAEQDIAPPEFELTPELPISDADSASSVDSAPFAEEAKVVQQKQEIPVSASSPARQITAAVATPELATAPSSELADGKDVIRLVFEGESWTEVRDIRGKLLLSRINPRGTEQVLHGKPPFSLAIGNAAQVKLVYNNKPIDLAPHINAYGGTARLSLN